MEKLHIPWSDIMGMWYYQLESCLDTYVKIVEERKKAEEENNKNGQSDPYSKYSPQNMMKQAQSMMPKPPKMQIPKF